MYLWLYIIIYTHIIWHKQAQLRFVHTSEGFVKILRTKWKTWILLLSLHVFDFLGFPMRWQSPGRHPCLAPRVAISVPPSPWRSWSPQQNMRFDRPSEAAVASAESGSQGFFRWFSIATPEFGGLVATYQRRFAASTNQVQKNKHHGFWLPFHKKNTKNPGNHWGLPQTN